MDESQARSDIAETLKLMLPPTFTVLGIGFELEEIGNVEGVPTVVLKWKKQSNPDLNTAAKTSISGLEYFLRKKFHKPNLEIKLIITE